MTSSDQHRHEQTDSLLGGVGSAELDTESLDPVELRRLLARARERLSFYEGFDRVIAENVRRSGELMLETLSMRESTAASAKQESQADRTRLLARVSDLDADAQVIQAHLASLVGQLAELRVAIDGGKHHPDSIVTSTPEPAAPVSLPVADIAAIAATWSEPRVIDVIVHHVSRAAAALSLQRYLGGLSGVTSVAAREFAEGVLRLQVMATNPLQDSDLVGWTEQGSVRVLQHQPQVIELELE